MTLKKQYFDQTLEYRNLQRDFDTQLDIADKYKKEHFQLENLEGIVQELRNDNRDYMDRIEELQATIFTKDRDIDKLRHQLKHGVVSGGISETFNHAYPGAGGSVSAASTAASRKSKIELGNEQ